MTDKTTGRTTDKSPARITDRLTDSYPKPREIVAHLDRYIVGQDDAKKAVAIALRNRWRRQNAPEDIRAEIMPNNIILIGPTGVGKTEIARRLADLAAATVHQGGSLEVHRGGVRGPRC